MSRGRWAGTAAALVAVVGIAAVAWRRHRVPLTAWTVHDIEDGASLPSAHAFGDDYRDCGCPDLYFCPASGEVECPRHGGGCCEPPTGHIPLRALPEAEDIVDGSPEHDWVDLVVGGTEFPRGWRPVVPPRRARVTAQTYRGRTVTLELDVVGRARRAFLVAQPRQHGWPTWHTWVDADQAVMQPRR